MQSGHLHLSLGLVQIQMIIWCYSNHKYVEENSRRYYNRKPLLTNLSGKHVNTYGHRSVWDIGGLYVCLFVITWSNDFFYIFCQ